MKLLIVTHDILTYEQSKKKMRWTRFPYLFEKLGHYVISVRKPEWWKYPYLYFKYKPDIVISVGKVAGLITAIHHKLPGKRNAIFVHDLTDHFEVYKSEKRIWFLRNNHDYVTAPTMYNINKFNCHDYVPNGSDFMSLKTEEFNQKEFDAVYIGQTQALYNIEDLKKSCIINKLKLAIVTDMAYEELPQLLSKCKIAVYPISWDSSVKMYDYAALGMPVVAPKPNIAEGVGYPAYYCEDLGEGIKYLIENPKVAKEYSNKLLTWFKEHSGNWEEQAEKYLKVLEKYMMQEQVKPCVE